MITWGWFIISRKHPSTTTVSWRSLTHHLIIALLLLRWSLACHSPLVPPLAVVHSWWQAHDLGHLHSSLMTCIAKCSHAPFVLHRNSDGLELERNRMSTQHVYTLMHVHIIGLWKGICNETPSIYGICDYSCLYVCKCAHETLTT